MFSAGKTAVKNNDANYVEDVFSTHLYTGNGSTQKINNGIQLAASIGGSVNFDGTGDYLSLPSNSAFTIGTGDVTIEAWVYVTSLDSGYSGIISGRLQDGVTGYPGLGLVIDANKFTFTIFNYLNALTDTVSAPTNQWVHVVGVRSGTNAALFVNGIRKASSTNSENGTSSAMNLGRFYPASDAYYFNGYISNARIVKGTAVYDPTQTTLTVPTAPLTAISGTSLLTCQSPNPLIDNSANAFPLTVNNAVAEIYWGPFGTDIVNSKGGMVWTKSRSNAISNIIVDTVRGGTNALITDLTNANSADSGFHISSFNSKGYSLQGAGSGDNFSGYTYASWTFRKQPKFFDVVTYTGNGSVSSIAHNLGSTPGCIIIKATNGTTPWAVYHRSTTTPNNYYLLLNTADAAANAGTVWCTPTSTEFTVQNTSYANASGVSYVAYIFAHDAGGFGLTGTDNVVSCGSFNGSTAGTVNLGYEPQWILFKDSVGTTGWVLYDIMRGQSLTSANYLFANTAAAEANTIANYIVPNATGFSWSNGLTSGTTIYIAIRRGPMKVPTLGTSVFGLTLKASYVANEIISTSFPPDMSINKATTLVIDNFSPSRLTGGWLTTNTTVAETAGTWKWDGAAGQGYATVGYSNAPIYYSFRRAPGFFDVVCYTGNGTTQAVSHNLNAVPELMITKNRNSAAYGWPVFRFNTGNGVMYLNTTAANVGVGADWWGNNTIAVQPTSTNFTVGSVGPLNQSTLTYITYLFATVPGVSKVGSYTGTGALQTIACGFTTGARFVLIKRTNAISDWYVWDSARGITSGTDPYLLLNSTATEIITTNYVDTDATGFKVTSAAPAELNAVGGIYLFLAIA